MHVDEIRNRILIAREQRASLRKQCAQNGRHSLSLSLNIPGHPKSTPLLSRFFEEVLAECKLFLQAHRIRIETAHEVRRADDAGDFYLVPLPAGLSSVFIKALGETFEESHPLGRIIDIDITDHQLQPVSSGKLKQCLLCEKPAVVCMREATHTYQELREYLENRIRSYLTEQHKHQTCRRIAALALKAILYEISVSPKPGLVGPFDQGAHRDMDYFTFLSSTSAISGYFEELAQSGHAFAGDDLTDALPLIRTIGLKMDDAMFSATRGVNTQRGLIFLIGLALFSAAHCIARDGRFTEDRCRQTIAAICANLVRNELNPESPSESTHGMACFRRYGPEGGGARKEAEAGLPAVFDHGLPELRSAFADSGEVPGTARLNNALSRTLMRLMAVTNDTNILYRKDLEALRTVQQMARDALNAGDPRTEEETFARLLSYCQREYISPGGSADLLAVTVFLYFVDKEFSARAIP